jgi:hypothetical protein
MPPPVTAQLGTSTKTLELCYTQQSKSRSEPTTEVSVTGVAAYTLTPLSWRAVLQSWGCAELYPMNQVR